MKSYGRRLSRTQPCSHWPASVSRCGRNPRGVGLGAAAISMGIWAYGWFGRAHLRPFPTGLPTVSHTQCIPVSRFRRRLWVPREGGMIICAPGWANQSAAGPGPAADSDGAGGVLPTARQALSVAKLDLNAGIDHMMNCGVQCRRQVARSGVFAAALPFVATGRTPGQRSVSLPLLAPSAANGRERSALFHAGAPQPRYSFQAARLPQRWPASPHRPSADASRQPSYIGVKNHPQT